MASYDEVKLEDILHGTFATFNPNTGANKDADSTPSLTVYEEGGTTVTTDASITNVSTGRYRWQFTVAAASGFEQGKFYDVWVSATVTGTDTVTQAAPVVSFRASLQTIDDISAVSSGTIQSIVSSGVTSTQSTQASNAQIGASGALQAYDPPTRAELTSDKDEIIASGITQSGVRTAVGLASANLDTQLDNIPTVTEFNARTLPSGTYSVLSSGDVQSIVTSGVTTTQSTQASNAQTGATASLNAYDPPTRAELTTDKLEIIASGITQSGVRTAVGLASANLDTQLDAIPTVTEMNARTLPSGSYSTLTSGNVVDATQTTVNNNYLQYMFASTYDPTSKPGSATSIINSLIDSSVRQFSATALELAPAGSGGAGGSGDWTSTEKSQIRYVLGLDGSTATPTASPSGLFRSNLVRVDGVTINGTGEVPVNAISIRNAVGLASANLDTQLADVPTVSEFNARTLPSGQYFDPATDTVATVTTLTNLPAITANWLTAAGLAADAVAEIQAGLSVLTSGVIESIVSSGVSATQSTQASNAQTGATASLNAYDPPTRTELTADKDEIIASGANQTINASGIRSAIGLASANLDTQLADIPTVSEFNARTLPSGNYSTLSASDISTMLSSGVTVNVVSSGAFQDIFETYSMVEDYPANGATGTPAEFLYLMKQAFTEFTINGTTITVKKLDGSTTAATYTMDSATTPTSRTRAT